jgi:ATP-dependent DNA helicase RecG
MVYTEHLTIEQLRMMRESEDHVEFKRAQHNYPFNGGSHTEPRDRRHCVLGYIAALANERGGLLVLGMEDELPHKVCGSDFAQGEEGNLVDAIYQKLHIRVDAYPLYDNNLRVLVISVPSRPIGRLLKFEGVALMRIGESLREMSDTEMLAILSEQEPDYSAKVCEGFTMDDVDAVAMAKLVTMYADKQNNSTFANQPYEQCLVDLGLMVNGKLNYAALMLVGKREAIHQFLPQDEIIIEYRLDEASIPFTARTEIQEPLLIAIDKAWNYINQPASNPLQHVNDGPVILDIPAFNEDAIREGLLNAVVHRSMQIQSSVVVKQSPRSISIVNAGGFPIGVDLNNILTTVSVPRAKRLCEVLEKTGLIERSGQGVDKIFYKCLAEGKALPDYSLSDAYQVSLVMKPEIINPAFYLFVKGAQANRSDNNKLSVFHLLALRQIAEGKTSGIQDSVLSQLLADGLVVSEAGKLRLCDAYYIALTRARGTVNSENGTVNGQNGTLNLKKGTLNSENGEVNQKNGTVNSKNGEINQKNGTVNSKNGEINQKNGTVNSKNGEVNRKNGTVNLKNGEINQKNGTVNLKNGTLNGIEDTKKYIVSIYENKDDIAIQRLLCVAKDTIRGTIKDRDLFVLAIIALENGVNSRKLGDRLCTQDVSIRKLIVRLSKSPYNLIERRGSDKTGGYYLTETGINFIEALGRKLSVQ